MPTGNIIFSAGHCAKAYQNSW